MSWKFDFEEEDCWEDRVLRIRGMLSFDYT